ncbi:hypothetical protein XH93_09875 [Bradyrhizobium sp. CCBAU 51753]|nr:hypothetical protein XH93_09875 [Bradyrhizobium sp. CCBAU 51753]
MNQITPCLECASAETSSAARAVVGLRRDDAQLDGHAASPCQDACWYSLCKGRPKLRSKQTGQRLKGIRELMLREIKFAEHW